MKSRVGASGRSTFRIAAATILLGAVAQPAWPQDCETPPVFLSTVITKKADGPGSGADRRSRVEPGAVGPPGQPAGG